MARLTDVDVDFISLVKKGANKQQIQIYKSDDFIEDEAIKSSEENKSSKLDGLFDVIKSYFTKSDDEEIKVTTFSSRIGNRELRSSMWDANDALIDTFYDIMNSDATNQGELLTQAVDEYAAYLKSKIVAGKIEKSFISRPGQEDGIKEIKNTKISKGEVKLTAEEMKEILDGAIKPITDRLDKLEGVEAGEEKAEEEVVEKSVKEEFAEVLKEVLDPLTERVEKIEKVKGISKQVEEEEEEPIIKSNSVFAGLDI